MNDTIMSPSLGLLDTLPLIVEWLDRHNGLVIAILTFVLAVINVIFILQNKRIRKSNEKPEVVAYIHPSKKEVHTIIDFTVINCGKSPAYDISIKSNTEQDKLEKAGICKIGHDTLCYVPVLPKDESLTAFFGQATKFMNQDELEEVSYTIAYRSSDGDRYKREQVIPLKFFGHMESAGNTAMRDIADNIKKITGHANSISNDIKALRSTIDK